MEGKLSETWYRARYYLTFDEAKKYLTVHLQKQIDRCAKALKEAEQDLEKAQALVEPKVGL
jgi:hypothetical protein